MVQTCPHSDDTEAEVTARILPLVDRPLMLARILAKQLIHQAEMQLRLEQLADRVRRMEEQ